LGPGNLAGWGSMRKPAAGPVEIAQKRAFPAPQATCSPVRHFCQRRVIGRAVLAPLDHSSDADESFMPPLVAILVWVGCRRFQRVAFVTRLSNASRRRTASAPSISTESEYSRTTSNRRRSRICMYHSGDSG
jgi:hypothetical protein